MKKRSKLPWVRVAQQCLADLNGEMVPVMMQPKSGDPWIGMLGLDIDPDDPKLTVPPSIHRVTVKGMEIPRELYVVSPDFELPMENAYNKVTYANHNPDHHLPGYKWQLASDADGYSCIIWYQLKGSSQLRSIKSLADSSQEAIEQAVKYIRERDGEASSAPAKVNP